MHFKEQEDLPELLFGAPNVVENVSRFALAPIWWKSFFRKPMNHMSPGLQKGNKEQEKHTIISTRACRRSMWLISSMWDGGWGPQVKLHFLIFCWTPLGLDLKLQAGGRWVGCRQAAGRLWAIRQHPGIQEYVLL